MIQELFSGTSVSQLQEKAVKIWHQNGEIKGATSFEEIVLLQHKHNYNLWHEEDEARRTDVGDAVIARVKRAIDKLNQARNDCIEKLDDYLLTAISGENTPVVSNPRRNSETPGSIIDKLSIISLRIFHMNEQISRVDADEPHKDKCRNKLGILEEQKRDLSDSLTELWLDIRTGKKILKVYRQFKMYNDASLNPALYNTRK